jgi:hypothetical protein
LAVGFAAATLLICIHTQILTNADYVAARFACRWLYQSCAGVDSSETPIA